MSAPHSAVVVVLLAVNGLLYASWFWLKDQAVGGNRRDPYLEQLYFEDGPTSRINQQAIFRNDGYIEPFLELVESKQRILTLGTSESIHDHNISNQMNAISAEAPKLQMYAESGMSPIHSCFFFAKCKRDGIKLPPLMMFVNLVYFTESHDIINDGWLTKVMPSDTFLQMDHGGLLNYVTADVQDLYEDHFANRRWFAPLTAQRYLGSLLFLRCNQPNPLAPPPGIDKERKWTFDGHKPEYDIDRNVQKGYRAPDRMSKNRWAVKLADECVNLAGLTSIMTTLADQQQPILLVILPTNRAYYAYNGLDMEEYDQRYSKLREAIRTHAQTSNVAVLDMYEEPDLDQGYADRMHADEYGDFQMAEFILGTPEFQTFHDQAKRYYGLTE